MTSKEYLLIVSKGCAHCEEAKNMAAKEGIRVLDIQESNEAVDIAMALNLRAVPSLVLREGEKVCLVGREKQTCTTLSKKQ